MVVVPGLALFGTAIQQHRRSIKHTYILYAPARSVALKDKGVERASALSVAAASGPQWTLAVVQTCPAPLAFKSPPPLCPAGYPKQETEHGWKNTDRSTTP